MNIGDEAVQAAVKAWDRHWGDRYGDEALEEMGEEVRVALEAAAPHLMAQAWDACADYVDDRYPAPSAGALKSANPYWNVGAGE